MPRSLLAPIESFHDLPTCDQEYLWELILLEETDWSPRERRRVEAAIERGDLWLVLHEQRVDSFVLSLLLEQPDSTLRVEFPNYVALRPALELVGRMFDTLTD